MQQRRDFIKQAAIITGGLILPFPLLSARKNEKMKQENQYDVIIIGGSYSGLAAGMALGRAIRNVLIIDSGNPCNKQTPHSHNFLTNDGKTPNEISTLARKQVLLYSSVSLIEGLATTAQQTKSGFEVQLQTGKTFTSRKLIFATGIKDVMPNIPGFSESWGISVLHCPYCHGYEVRHQKTGILANGDTGFELSSLISNWTTDLTLYTNGPSTLTEEQKQKLDRHQIHIVETEISKIETENGYIRHMVFADGTRASLTALYARLPFVQHTSLPQELGCALTQEGYLQVDPAHRTAVPGIFACGDNTTRMRTVANAVAMGTTTGLMLNKELIEEDF